MWVIKSTKNFALYPCEYQSVIINLKYVVQGLDLYLKTTSSGGDRGDEAEAAAGVAAAAALCEDKL